MSHFRGYGSLNFDKEYFFGFETSLCNFRDLIYVQSACNSKEKGKLEITSYDPLKISVAADDFYIKNMYLLL